MYTLFFKVIHCRGALDYEGGINFTGKYHEIFFY